MTERLVRALEKPKGNTAEITTALKRAESSVAAALPEGFPGGPARFARIVLTAVRLNPDLANCTPMSVLGSAMQAAQLGLTPGVLGECWLIGYGGEATFQLGWKGVMVLASRAGFTLTGATVREGDLFDFELGTTSYIKHRPNRDTEGRSLYWYCIASERANRSIVNFAVLNRAMVEKRRKLSKAPNSPAWTKFYDEMALGKAARECCRFLPMSVEMASAFHSEEHIRTAMEGEPADYTGFEDTGDETPPVGTATVEIVGDA